MGKEGMAAGVDGTSAVEATAQPAAGVEVSKPAPEGQEVAEKEGKLPQGVMPGMVRTSSQYCSGCFYGGKGKALSGCNWYLWTKTRRGCPVGWCDKFTPAKGRKKPKQGFGSKEDYMFRKREEYKNAEESHGWES